MRDVTPRRDKVMDTDMRKTELHCELYRQSIEGWSIPGGRFDDISKRGFIRFYEYTQQAVKMSSKTFLSNIRVSRHGFSLKRSLKYL